MIALVVRLGVVCVLLVGSAHADGLRPVVSRGGWPIELGGYLQLDWVPYREDSVDELDPSAGTGPRRPLNQERFLVRRARLRLETQRDGVFANLELDGNTVEGATARLLAAQVGWRYPARGAPVVEISAGLFKTPFGTEVPTPDRDKPFVEAPAFARGLFPGSYDAGAMVQGRYGIARYAVAVMNGAPSGDAQWRGLDPLSSVDLVGRVGASIAGPRQWRIEAGVSAIVGKGLHAGTPATKDELRWIDENQDGLVQLTELMLRAGTPATPSETFDRDALGADVQLHWCLCVVGTGTAFAEVAIATNLDRGLLYADPIAASRDLRHLGFAVGVVQNLGAHLQAGVRYDRYDADRDASERAGVEVVQTEQVFSTLGMMIAGRWRDARVSAQYDLERNPFGRGDDGAPTTRRADRLTLRAQVGF